MKTRAKRAITPRASERSEDRPLSERCACPRYEVATKLSTKKTKLTSATVRTDTVIA